MLARARFCVDALFLFIDAGSRLFFCSQTPLSCDFFLCAQTFRCAVHSAICFSMFNASRILFSFLDVDAFVYTVHNILVPFFSIYALFRVIFVLHISFYAA